LLTLFNEVRNLWDLWNLSQ